MSDDEDHNAADRWEHDNGDLDRAALPSHCRTVAWPFGSPSTGRIVVKVINHYGDEVLKVYDT